MNEQIEIRHGMGWGTDTSGLWIIKYVWNNEHTKIVRQYVLQNGQWKQVKEGEDCEFSVLFTANDAHIFNDAMERFKKRNANYENRDKEIDAIKEHLHDMRNIVFSNKPKI